MKRAKRQTNKSPDYLQLFVKSILGGGFIALGCLTAVIGGGSNSLLYALIFPVGLAMLVWFGASLFTGAATEINQVLDRKTAWQTHAQKLGVIWLGNLAGSILLGLVTLLVAKPATIELLQTMAAAKVATPMLALFVKALMCNVLVCTAILLWRKTSHVLAIYLPVFVFVLCGFEHSVADMFIFTVAPSWWAVVPLLLISLGNWVGGALISMAYRYTQEKS